MPDGVASNFQAGDPYPIYLDARPGRHVWDVDGNEYVDFHGGFGVNVVGHAHPKIVEAIDEGHRERHALRGDHREDGGAGRGDLPAVRPRAGAVRQLGHRGDHGRHPGGPRRDRPRPHRQDGGLVPRPPRRGAVLGGARGRRPRPAGQRRDDEGGRLHDAAHVEGRAAVDVARHDRRARSTTPRPSSSLLAEHGERDRRR